MINVEQIRNSINNLISESITNNTTLYETLKTSVLPRIKSIINEDNKNDITWDNIHEIFDTYKNYLSFTAVENNCKISLNETTAPNIKYSLNGKKWIEWDYNQITLNIGDIVFFKGNNEQYFSKSTSEFNMFIITGKVKAHGNIMSLLYGDNFIDNLSIDSDYCFYSLFNNCKDLLTAPLLPATTLSNYCYANMFNNCTSLTKTHELPSKVMKQYCYSNMFNKCTSLTTMPELSANILSSYCYQNMFNGCTLLKYISSLPANVLAEGCYEGMFEGCTSLESAPKLNAEEIAVKCYKQMFKGCTSLNIAPYIYATTLFDYCYYEMFYGCTSLEKAPILYAETLMPYCYTRMFYNCNKLNYIECCAIDISANNCLTNWVYGVAGTGKFIREINSSFEISANGIPLYWDFEYYIPNYFKLTAIEQDSKIFFYSNIDEVNLSVSFDGKNWMLWDYNETGIRLNKDMFIYIRGNNYAVFNSCDENYNQFVLTGKWEASGNIMSLLYETNFNSVPYIPQPYCFMNLFNGCESLLTAPELPAEVLNEGCYLGMFEGCTSLTKAPELPAFILANCCYDSMFAGCISLTEAPELPAEFLNDYCYSNMFSYCEALINAPELPAVELADNCYSGMFSRCISLKKSPKLPATKLAPGCYATMFLGCTSLTFTPDLPATDLVSRCYWGMFWNCKKVNLVKIAAENMDAVDCLSKWLTNVSNRGVIRKKDIFDLEFGENGIPNNWISKYYE